MTESIGAFVEENLQTFYIAWQLYASLRQQHEDVILKYS